MKILETDLPGVLILEPRVFYDDRGYFLETYNAEVFRRHGLPDTFLQDNHSRSSRGVVRGLHYQMRNPQGKLLRCIRGAIFDVAVDIRRSSPHFGRWAGIELSAENWRMLWIPPGFAHGFATLMDDTEVTYKCTTTWDAGSDRSLLWNDPAIGIGWPVAEPIISAKDAVAPTLNDAEVYE
ncbi:MAG: dTDP-4-dehydrorhamnose 3,5-epimerase [Thermoanaerobaculia bacterium]